MSEGNTTGASAATSVLSEHTRHEIDAWVAKFPAGKQRSASLAALRADPARAVTSNQGCSARQARNCWPAMPVAPTTANSAPTR